jgi:hypothetical protein
MCIDGRYFYLSFISLMALAFVGTLTLGEHAWVSCLILVPASLILIGLSRVSEQQRPNSIGLYRALRIALALVGLSILAALLIDALELDGRTTWIVVVPMIVLVSLVDREYFGWTDSHGDAGRSHTA